MAWRARGVQRYQSRDWRRRNVEHAHRRRHQWRRRRRGGIKVFARRRAARGDGIAAWRRHVSARAAMAARKTARISAASGVSRGGMPASRGAIGAAAAVGIKHQCVSRRASRRGNGGRDGINIGAVAGSRIGAFASNLWRISGVS